MSTPTLFLDIDGVLRRALGRPVKMDDITIEGAEFPSPDVLDDWMLDRLETILRRRSAELVISSAWRLPERRTTSRFRAYFSDRVGRPLIGTSITGQTPSPRDLSSLEKQRADAIERYVADEDLEAEAVAIVDDMPLRTVLPQPLAQRFVKTSPRGGLSQGTAQSLLITLNPHS